MTDDKLQVLNFKASPALVQVLDAICARLQERKGSRRKVTRSMAVRMAILDYAGRLKLETPDGPLPGELP